MFSKINFQYLISYLGLIPFILIIFNKYFILQVNEEKSQDFTIYYTLLIFVFIGAINWNLKERINNLTVIYGFIPSFLSAIIIIVNLLNYSISIIFSILILLICFQLVLDYFFVYLNTTDKKPFYLLRLPLSILISLSLFIIIL